MVKVLVYVFILLTFIRGVSALDYYLYIKPETYVSHKDGIINFKLTYNFDPNLLKGFYIKPISSSANVEIFNDKLGQWISENDMLTRMPELKEKISVRFKSFPKEITEIHFKIYKYKTPEVFETAPTKIWSSEIMANYMEKFNENLYKVDIETENKDSNEVSAINLVQTKNSKEISEIQPAKKSIPVALLFFVISAVVGHIFSNLVKLRSAFG
ncbi:hypothetical protein A3H26_03515 [candidate division WWE3 bacterium RIFCSPLOWO2_12_FULL_36_10]|uniref:Uncharacterized protein n=1 Tax=candidate division WWE3 bacterium RIFCSPLOWO2_12_FULL_36_10 TaxID=1802630 RepID=A0A1F4VLA8_UNCKA|nr:MAG: hypothetical protein A3H26_03515 [candidate division WWE3 bacterium RIFCSPLOWO2_12_FULL_36_10]